MIYYWEKVVIRVRMQQILSHLNKFQLLQKPLTHSKLSHESENTRSLPALISSPPKSRINSNETMQFFPTPRNWFLWMSYFRLAKM